MKNICLQMNSRRWLSFLFLICLALPSIAQEITIKGIIRGVADEPLIGANVIVKDAPTVGTITDFSGNYQLKVDSDATIVVSYVGYTTKEVAVAGKTEINVILEEGGVKLDEVVAIGYGTVKKEDATGAVSMVKPTEIESAIATSAQELLTGTTPGLVITADGGQPEGGGTIRIRGGSSLSASNDPLIVIDGVPLDNNEVEGVSNPLAMIAPDNIESIAVLKDASATAIYGSRASNGVIIVTTKKGTAGKPKINFSANMYINTASDTWDALDATAFSALVIERYGADSEAAALLGTANTNWQDEILRTAISNDVNLSIGGTAGFLPYRISANYTNREGILKTSSMQRAIFGFTLTPKFFDDHLSVSANAKGYYINNKIVSQSIVSGALTSDPTRTVMSEYDMASGSTGTLYNGYNAWINAGTINTQAQTNVVAYLDERDTQADVLKSNGNLQLDYSLHALPELRFNLNLGYDITDAEYHVDIADNSQSAWRSYNQDGAATRYIATQEKTNTLLDFYMNYKKEFDFIQSNLDATAGYSWQKFTASGGNNGTEFLTAGYNEVSMTDGQYNLTVNEANNDRIGTTYTADPSSEDWATQLQLLSFFGRVNYSVMNRYLLTATLRADATSRFSPDNRWGYFPSLALGWKITEESFMESARDVMNEFKLRASYGVTGQQDLGDDYFPYMAIYSSSVQGSYYVDREGTGTYISTLYPEGYNTSLKWEETKTWNVGFDFGFLSNRITASLDYYFRNTDDLLSYVPVAAGSTTTNYLNLNVGSMESQGVEFAIVTKPVVTKDFTWTLGYNVAWNENEITKLNNQDDEDAYIATGDIGGMTAITVQAHKVGYPAYSFYLYEQVYDADGYPMEGVYVDQNDDGYINDNDKVISKSKDPKVTMALNSNMSYKNWDFGFSLRANFGAYVYNGVLTNRTNLSNLYMGGSLTNLLESDFYFDGSVATTSLYMSDYFLSKADFLRCDNITLGYTWENLLSDKLRLRVYGAVQNPFIITGYSGLDPEIYSGIDNEVYPSAVTYTLGVIATF